MLIHRKFAGTLLLLSAQALQAQALNWEGHETWFHEAAPIPELTDGIPTPRPQLLPSCESRAAATAKNSAEQVPIPGRNCWMSREKIENTIKKQP